ncbi:small ribosomal subunit protein uS14m [Bacillus rossius redtenbacheri]|uniref:small ribosomal subunit protein uS14m n=1 Tax=Bacillus rossius redtenbacheri TaxID=93214 RepID=UPI002FDE7D3A
MASLLFRWSGYVVQNLQVFNLQVQPVRTKYADWKMIRDLKRRRTVKQYAVEKLRVNSLRKNDVLPYEIRELASQDIAAMPLNAHLTRTHKRCAVTSRARGLVHRWRLSRIVWRHLADYNKLSGVQRAMW